MNKQEKLNIINKINKLPKYNQSDASYLFELIYKFDKAIKLPVYISFWFSVIIFWFSVYFLQTEKIDKNILFMLSVLIMTIVFFTIILLSKIFYFNFKLHQILYEFDYVISRNKNLILILNILKKIDPQLNFLINQMVYKKY